MTGRIVTCAAALTVALAAAPRSASAYQYWVNGALTEPVYHQMYYTSAGSHYFKVSNLVQTSFYTPDVAMVVKTDEGSYHAQSCGWDSKGACLTADSTDGVFEILVFATATGHSANGDVNVDGTAIATNVPMSGALYSVTAPAGTYSVYTAQGQYYYTSDTVLYLLDSSLNLIAEDDDGGVKYQALLYKQALSPGEILLAAPYDPNEQGYADILINACPYDPDLRTGDCSSVDSDGDFLADSLEAELGTRSDKWDTDGDGISDFYETIGRYSTQLESYLDLPLPAMGANPLHADVFVETDRQDSIAPLSQSWADTIRDTYNAISTIHNPDGTTGVHIHLDTGQPCTSPDQTVCNNWGGAQAGLPYGDPGHSNPGDSSPGDYTGNYANVKQDGYFAPVRWGIFHYVYLSNDSSCLSAGSTKNVPGTASWADGNCDPSTPDYVQHEVGHELGLQHWGDPSKTPSGEEMNAKQSYPSLMNYVFQNPGSNKPTPRFSDGSRATLHPYDLPEPNYSPDAGVADLSYLGQSPLNFLTNITTQEHQVDFNRDGRFGVPDQSGVVPSGSTTAVAFDTSPIGTAATGAGWPELYQRQVFTSSLPYGGGALVNDPTAQSGTVAWQFSPYEDGSTEPIPTKIYVNRVTFDDSGGPAWTGEGSLPDLPSLGGDVTAAWFPVGNDEVVALYPNGAEVLDYYLMDTSNPGGGAWQPIPGWPSGVTATNASATVSGGKLVVVFRDTNAAYNDPAGNVYITTMDSSGTWTAPELVQGVSSLVTPGIAEAADGTVYMAIANGTETGFPIEFFRKGSGSLGDGTGWQPTALGSIGSSLNQTDNDAGARINLLSVPYLDQNLTPFPDGSGYLAVFWSTGDPNQTSGHPQGWHLVRAYTTGYFSPSGDTAGPPEGSGWHRQQQEDRAYPGHSVAVAEAGGNVMAFYTGSNWGSAAPENTWFAPYVTGITPTGHDPGDDDDNDDGATIAANMCLSAWLFVYDASQASCYCQTGNPSCLHPSTVTVTTMSQPCPP